MSNLPLSIGILSWASPQTIRHTLESYAQAGLLDLAAQIFVFFQEISDDDIKVAKEYNLRFEGSERNLGIAGGYRQMLRYIDQPYYLFLENDWVINDPDPIVTIERLSQGIHLLDNSVDFVKYRSRLYPGNPLWSRQWAGGNELYHPEHLLECIHWRTDESIEKNFPDELNNIGDGWFRTTSEYGNWTNNPHLVRTEWLNKSIASRLGTKDIERDIQTWWRQQNFTVAQGDGLFTHYRLDR